MPSKHESILDKGYWEEIEPKSKPTALAHAAKCCIDLVRPLRLSKTTSPRKQQQLRRTAYLDGLRGFAAFLVYWHHHQLWSRDGLLKIDRIFENAFGYNDEYYLACLPAVRTFFSGGHYAVSTFFVISGYVLCAKPMSLIHGGEYMKLGDNTASALFRRWLRLHIPIIVTTFLYMTSWHAFGIWTDADHQPNYREELWNWYCQLKNFTFVFRSGGEPWFWYNFHLWSIPMEFRGSIVIYTSLLAFSRLTRNARLWCEVGLIFYFMYIVDGWFCAMFVAGMLLCDLDLLAANNNLPRFFWKLESFKELIFYNLLVLSVYLGGVPSHDSDMEVLSASYGWHYLSYLKPQAFYEYKWFFLFWAATFLVAAVPRIPWLKGFFETRFCQYLGRISYALYLVHGPILWTLGDRLYSATGWTREAHAMHIPQWMDSFPLSKKGMVGLEMSFLAPHIILLPLTLWLAELVTVLIDEPSVKVSQWLYDRSLAPSAKI